jgi:hypothetical protein
MPFGLTNAPAIFQHMITDIFRDMLNVCVIVYLDDILIFSDDEEQHEKHVRAVMDRLRKYRLYCKPEKCHFFTQKLNYLGYVITPDGISMDPAKVQTVIDWRSPACVKDVQKFLGFANFYRRFIDQYAAINKPMSALVKKGKNFEWTSDAQTAFDQLKQAFTSPPILLHGHADTSKPFIVETDASNFAIAAVVSQYQEDNILHPIAFFSHQLRDSEPNLRRWLDVERLKCGMF